MISWTRRLRRPTFLFRMCTNLGVSYSKTTETAVRPSQRQKARADMLETSAAYGRERRGTRRGRLVRVVDKTTSSICLAICWYSCEFNHLLSSAERETSPFLLYSLQGGIRSYFWLSGVAGLPATPSLLPELPPARVSFSTSPSGLLLLLLEQSLLEGERLPEVKVKDFGCLLRDAARRVKERERGRVRSFVYFSFY